MVYLLQKSFGGVIFCWIMLAIEANLTMLALWLTRSMYFYTQVEKSNYGKSSFHVECFNVFHYFNTWLVTEKHLACRNPSAVIQDYSIWGTIFEGCLLMPYDRNRLVLDLEDHATIRYSHCDKSWNQSLQFVALLFSILVTYAKSLPVYTSQLFGKSSGCTAFQSK